MIFTIYKRALAVLAKKPFRLWGLSLLCPILTVVASILFGIIPGIALAISMCFSTSMLMVYLHGYRGEEVKTVQLFDCFRSWETIKRTCLGLAWEALWIFLWALIPVVGFVFAFIRGFEYYLTPYILVQEPDVPLTEAINVSKERMKGYKGKLFWAMVLPFVIVYLAGLILVLLALIPYIGWIFSIVAFVLFMVFALFGSLFLGLVGAAFYEEISNPTIAPDAPAFDTTVLKEGAAALREKAASVVNKNSEPAKFCPNCGAKNETDATFCANCGTKL